MTATAPEPTLDVVAVGNALVDVLSPTTEDFLADEGLYKGAMAIIDADRSATLYGRMGPATEMSGGSAANTAVGIASLGGRSAFVGRVHDDVLGQVFAHDIRAARVGFDVPAATSGPPTGRCLILVTPDGERTMNTYLGAAADLHPDDIPPSVVGSAAVTYLEGYLFDQPDAKAAFRHAAQSAHAAGRRVALSLSDPFCVERHRLDFLALVEHEVDILFANEAEACLLFEVPALDDAVTAAARTCEVAVVTQGAKGSVVVDANGPLEVPVHPVPTGVVDTTGAGDLYAAGFLFAFTRGHELAVCGRVGALAASEVIAHYGARPEHSLADLAAPLLR